MDDRHRFGRRARTGGSAVTSPENRLEALSAESASGFEQAGRRYRDRLAAAAPAPREDPVRVQRLRARLRADADAADAVLGRLMLAAGLDAARPRSRGR